MTGADRSWVALLTAALLTAAVAAPGALAQTGGDPGLDGARAAFDALTEQERIAAQDALVWTGDSLAAADGTFGRRTVEGIVSWQRRGKRPATGILDRAGFAALLAAGQRARGAVGFAIVADAASGVRIGIPQRLLTKRTPNAIGGTRFQSADERVTLDTRSQPGGAEDLRSLYDRNLAIQTSGRTITYRLLRPEVFVVSGETPGGRFFSRYAQEGGTIRGFSIGYDKALAPELDRLTAAIANSFQPFGAARPAPGPVAEQQAPRPVPAAGTPAEPPVDVSPAAGPAFTGLAVSPRRVLAPAALAEACREPRLDGTPGRIVSAASGLAILEPAAPRPAMPLPFADGAGEGPALVLFHATGEGGRAVVAPAEIVAGGRVVAPLQEGAAGAVLLDRAGAIAGMVGALGSGRRAVAGLVPPASYGFVGAGALREAAPPEMRATAPLAGASRAALAAAILPALVRITCPAPPMPLRRP